MVNDFRKYSELYHHGIEGMHWGQRNGPPYPLDYQSHSLEEKQKNSRFKTYNENYRLKTYNDSRQNKSKSLELDKQRAERIRKSIKTVGNITKFATVGASIAGPIILAMSNGYKLKDIMNKDYLKVLGMQSARNFIRSAPKQALILAGEIAAWKVIDKAIEAKYNKKGNKNGRSKNKRKRKLRKN